MGLMPTFDVSTLMKGVRQEVEKMERYVQAQLEYVGLEFVRTARVKADFTDRTGNLRSSIGYVILKNGKLISDHFENSENGTDKDTGKVRGLEFAMANASALIGYVLIVVAGMEYAVFVEAHGFDVLTGSSLKADQDLKEVFQKLQKLKG